MNLHRLCAKKKKKKKRRKKDKKFFCYGINPLFHLNDNVRTCSPQQAKYLYWNYIRTISFYLVWAVKSSIQISTTRSDKVYYGNDIVERYS